MIVSPQFNKAKEFSEGFAPVKPRNCTSIFLGGWYLLEHWYIALCLLFAALVYMISKPESIFQLAGLVLEKLSSQTALRMYERAIKIAPKNARNSNLLTLSGTIKVAHI